MFKGRIAPLAFSIIRLDRHPTPGDAPSSTFFSSSEKGMITLNTVDTQSGIIVMDDTFRVSNRIPTPHLAHLCCRHGMSAINFQFSDERAPLPSGTGESIRCD